MKTLKQIREEYDNKYVSRDYVSDEMVLEAKSKSLMRPDVPSPTQMPTLLLFRRISYRLYPNNQVVALYYSKMVDKYLSVPFGPTGNLNLSESSIYDTLEELELAEGAKWEAAKGAMKGAMHGAIRGAAVGNVVAPGPGTVVGAAIGGARGAFKGAKRRLDKKPVNEIWNALGPILGGAAIEAFKSAMSKANQPVNAQSKAASTELKREKPTPTKKSSWKKSDDPVAQSRIKALQAAELKKVKSGTVNENSISNLRKMVNEDIDSMNININGREITLNTNMAKRILEVYDSVNVKNKKIVENMLNEDLESFKKLLNFSIKA